MNYKNFLIVSLCLSFFIANVAAQKPSATAAKPTPANELPPEIKNKAVNLLRTTAKDANSLSLPENRLAFLIATADKLWQYDETMARETFQNAQNDVRQMIVAQYQKQAAAAKSGEADQMFDSFMSGSGSMMDVESIRNLREAVVMTLAKHDGAAAYRFLVETRQPRPEIGDENSGSGARIGTRSNYGGDEYRENGLELKLGRTVAQNDPQKALEIGQQRLAVGVSEDLLSLTVRLYLKDKTRGAALASDFLKKVKASNLSADTQVRNVGVSLLKNGANALKNSVKDTDSAKTPFLKESDLRDLADTITRASLAVEDTEGYSLYLVRANLPLLEKYAPASGSRLRQKLFPQSKSGGAKTEGAGIGSGRTMRGFELRAKKEAEAMSAMQDLLVGGKTDEKTALEQARKTLSNIKNPLMRLTMGSQIAVTLSERGQTDAAKELLNDARKTLNPQPKFWGHFIETLMVARGYAAVDPKQSLDMLENIVYQLDDTIGGLAKFGEFIAGETAVKDGELRLSGVPGLVGGGMISQISRGGGANFSSGFEKDFMKLAKADFERTAALADKFTRPEIRLMGRLLLINSLLPQEDEAADIFAPASFESDEEMPDVTVTTSITTTTPQ